MSLDTSPPAAVDAATMPPVLFIVFNRPGPTRQVFEAIRAARPPRLYVAADAARADRPGEQERCAQVRAIATAVDWPCEVRTLFRDTNLGCRLGCATAIDWFFEAEPEGIILEDDILPQPGFFEFCASLLERYRDDESVSMVSGCSFIGRPPDCDADYVFTRYMHIWGWASWRRAWRHYDLTMSQWRRPAAAARLARVLGGRRAAIAHWTALFDAVGAGKVDTWDYQWVFSSWMADMTAIMPPGMLVRNLGFGDDATHTVGPVPRSVRDAPPARIAFPLRRPNPGPTTAVDRRVERVAYGLGWRRRSIHLVRHIPVLGSALARLRAVVMRT